MRLAQLHDLKVWHQLHWRRHPLEKNNWDAVLTFWLAGWVGFPTAWLTHTTWAEAACVPLVFLPGLYVALRHRLHRARIVRCDWITALR